MKKDLFYLFLGGIVGSVVLLGLTLLQYKIGMFIVDNFLEFFKEYGAYIFILGMGFCFGILVVGFWLDNKSFFKDFVEYIRR